MSSRPPSNRVLRVTSGDDDHVTALALAAGHGDDAALEQFVKATQRDVWRSVAYLGDPGTADDLTQETFLRAIASLPRFSGRSSARTWLLSIARRVVVDQIRRNQARPRTQHTVDVDVILERHRPVQGFENLVEIRVLLDGLDEDRRHALLLTQVLGLSYAEAAEVCSCPVGTIRSRVARAREDLTAAVQRTERTG
ncbi:RNA polymerase sigma factor SigC [Mycolicibacterium austroafricanum]|uniref:RNA polymerase sigma factor n=1 Tax=Mycolicibacterium austroafricanum TaxID=39687 RepID=A0ABT8HAZ2_MYCAO|nr:RNA polymerase sigma factor SigC [Mycolicibacterium austroafricanum]MDN4517442.1 RNA polymerase sigma factor SigC [Mycolicibacterium austroafricanum]QRZ07589.1 RNA polymerase sigma factor SigC [Mycolicibacterium austroafricanum]QZT69252.1 RNA polymerase sigma factor SigC [Mycolicibacterium austroafricanum]